jgi:hypothetical protein
MSLPTDPKARKQIPIYSGFIKYFPLAIIEIAKVSFEGNAQHNGPDAPLFWDRSKSGDELDAMMRHLFDEVLGAPPEGKTEHLAKQCWRSLAELQKHMERKQNVQTSNSVVQKPAQQDRDFSLKRYAGPAHAITFPTD